MNALLLVAHGSRREASNEEIRVLTKALEKHSGHEFLIVEPAFLELGNPSITDGVSNCVGKGAETITVLPYFLAAGRHVVVDIPEELQKSQIQHPQVQIKMAPYLGSAKEISSILISLSQQAS